MTSIRVGHGDAEQQSQYLRGMARQQAGLHAVISEALGEFVKPAEAAERPSDPQALLVAPTTGVATPTWEQQSPSERRAEAAAAFRAIADHLEDQEQER